MKLWNDDMSTAQKAVSVGCVLLLGIGVLGLIWVTVVFLWLAGGMGTRSGEGISAALITGLVILILILGRIWFRRRRSNDTLLDGKSPDQYWKDFYANKDKED